MSPIFNITPVDPVSEDTSLFGEVSNEGFSYFFVNNKNKSVEGLTVFHFEKRETENDISGLLKNIFDEQPLLKNKYLNIFISYAFKESILTPGIYYNPAQNIENINFVYGDLIQGLVLADDIKEKDLHNIYRIPYGIHEAITNHFHGVKFAHKYSLLVKQSPHYANALTVLFYPTRVVISLFKNDKLQIIQTFSYATAEDVVYNMLNVCHQFKAEKINVELTGMIEKDSALFKQIHKYFLVTGFSHLPDSLSYAETLKAFPSHFFSHLFSIALCV